jgi:4-hydroxy-2-oxoglutarate aldolase
MSVSLAGAFIPNTTPFDPVTGDLDLVALRGNVRMWAEHPVSGLVIAGSTGESVFLDESERVEMVAACREALPEDRLLICGTGLESARATMRLTAAAADAGAQAVLVQPPAYYRGAMTPEVLRDHFVTVAEASPVPVILYQVPLHLSTLDLPNGLIAELSRHPNIIGIKDSRGKLDLVGELVEICDDGFQVMVGNGAILYAALEIGAVGGIMAVAGLAPAESAGIHRAFAAGQTAEAGRLQEIVAPVHKAVVGGMGVPGVKAAMDLLGYRGGAPRAPLRPFPESRMDELRGVLDAAGLLGAGAGAGA